MDYRHKFLALSGVSMKFLHIISRDVSASLGMNAFFTGQPCVNGHISIRYTNSSKCAECIAVRGARRQAEHGERLRAEIRKDYKENPEKYSAYNKRYRTVHKSSLSVAKSAYYEQNKELIAEYQRKYRDVNREILSARLVEYRNAEREKVRAWNRNRKARARNAEGHHSAEDVIDILMSQNEKCNSCGIDLADGYHVDHIMPLILGGSNWPSNLQMLCPTCNTSKGGLHPDDWEKKRRKLGL